MLPMDKLINEIRKDTTQKSISKNTKNFIKALNKGQTITALKFITQGVDVNAKNKNGDSLLTIAAQKGDLKIAIALTEKGANVLDSFFQSVDKNYVKAIKFLLDKLNISIDLDQFNSEEQTALMIAADNNNANMIKLLAYYGADIEKSALILYEGGNLLDASFLLQTSNYNEMQEHFFAQKDAIWQNLAEQQNELYGANPFGRPMIENDEYNLDPYLIPVLFPMALQNSPYFTVTPIAGSFHYTFPIEGVPGE